MPSKRVSGYPSNTAVVPYDSLALVMRCTSGTCCSTMSSIPRQLAHASVTRRRPVRSATCCRNSRYAPSRRIETVTQSGSNICHLSS